MSTGVLDRSVVKRLSNSRIHFSWLYCVFAIVWGVFSLVLFSDSTLRLLNETKEVAVGSPWNSADWVKKGESADFVPCTVAGKQVSTKVSKQDSVEISNEVSKEALCVDAHSAGRSSLMRYFDMDKAHLESADYFLVAMELGVSDLSTTRVSLQDGTALDRAASGKQAELPAVTHAGASPANKNPKSSLVVVSAYNNDNRLMRFLLPPVYLHVIGDQTVFRKMTPIHSRTDRIRMAFITYATGQWTLSALSVHTLTLGLPYKLLRWTVFAGWLGALLLLVRRLIGRVHPVVKGAVVVVVGLAISVGVGGAAHSIFASITSFLDSLPFDVIPDVGIVKTNWQPALHFIVHLFVTVYCYKMRRDLNLNTLHIVLINVALAVGVECVQLGVPERSADLGDIALAMAGMIAGIILCQMASTVSRAHHRT